MKYGITKKGGPSAMHKMRMKRRQGWVTRQIEKIKEENVCIHIFIGGEDQQ